jgi:hypothetical protein
MKKLQKTVVMLKKSLLTPNLPAGRQGRLRRHKVHKDKTLYFIPIAADNYRDGTL